MEFASLHDAAHRFLQLHAGSEILVVAMERTAVDDVVRSLPGSQLGIHRYSLRQLVAAFGRTVLAQRRMQPITRLSAEAMAAQVIDRTPLAYFAPVARTPGFPAALLDTLTRLRGERQEAPEGDLRSLASAYQAELKENSLADATTQLEAAIDVVGSGDHPLLGLPTLLLDLQPTSSLEKLFVNQLRQRARTVESLDSEVGPKVNTSALVALQNQLFAERTTPPVGRGGVEFFSAPGEALECVEITRRILRSNLPFDQCAVLLRHPTPYQPLIEDALRRAGIPAWFTHGVIRPDSSGRSFLALLHCANEGLSASRFAEYLSHAQKDQPRGWERLLVDAAVVGGRDRWERRIEGLAEELQDRLSETADDVGREGLNRQLDRLAGLRTVALPLIEQLDSLRAPRLWGEWLDGLRSLAENALTEPETVFALLDQLEPLRLIGPVQLADVLRVLSEHLGTLRGESRGYRYGRVFVGSIEEARGMVFQLVCVPGLCEGAFPTPLFDDSLLPGNLADLETRERLLLRQAIAPATGCVLLSWSRIELASGRLRVPSFYVLEAARAAFGQAIDRRAIERDAEQNVETRIGWPAPENCSEAIDETEYDLARLRPALAGHGSPGLAAYLSDISPTLYRSLRTRWNRWHRKWSTADGLILTQGVSPGPLQKFGLSARPYSPSSLQLFASCPYRFALHSVMGLEPLQDTAVLDRIDPLTRGSLFHEVQRRLFRRLGASPANSINIQSAGDVLDEVLLETAAEYAERLAPPIPQIWVNEIERLRADLRGQLVAVAEEQRDWNPIEVEKAFDTVTIYGDSVLRGQVDLVEQNAQGELRVTDYKTGSFPDPPPQVTGRGEMLQPLLYALAAEQIYSGRPIEGGRLFYATLRGGYKNINVPLNEGNRAEAHRVLSTINNAVIHGRLPAAPREDACEYCDYLIVCGPYEEERVRRKPQGELSALIQLRDTI